MKFDLNSYLKELEYLVNLDSGQGGIEGICAVGDFFADRFSKMGWIVETYDLRPHTGNCVVVKNREAERYDLMLLGHIDTVFPAGEATRRPFHRDEEKCYGVGVIDMKQGCLSMLHILEALPQKVNESLNILAVFNPDEEVFSPWSAPIQHRYAAISDKIFVFEAGSANGAITIERKGSTSLAVEIIGTAGHAGYMLEKPFLSSVTEAVHWVNELHRFHSAERGTSVNVGVFRAGEKSNIVAEKAHVEWDIRYYAPEEREKLEDCIKKLYAHAEQGGYTVRTLRHRISPALVPTEDTLRYVERMKEVSRRMNRPFSLKKRGGLSDANHNAAFCSVCIDNLGASGDFDHSEKEYLSIKTIEPFTAFAYELICDLAKEKEA